MGTFWGLIFQRVPFSFKQKRIDRVRNYGSADVDPDGYYNNPIEVAAREYAEEWTWKY